MKYHAKLPFRLIGKQGTAIWSGDNIVASIPKSRRANAEFIVKACNNHYQLLDALKVIEFRVSALVSAGVEIDNDMQVILYDAKEAIKKAEQ